MTRPPQCPEKTFHFSRARRVRLSALVLAVLFTTVARAQEDDEPPGKPPRTRMPPVRGGLQPSLKDRAPMQIKERAGGLNPKGPAPTVAKPPPQTPPPVVTPPPPAPAPSPPPPPLPGATSILGGGPSRSGVAQVEGTSSTEADDKRKKSGGKFLFNQEQANLVDIVKQISKLTGKNFILRENLKGQKITILCEEPITAREAYRAFLVALEVNNLAMVPAGKFWKIEERKQSIRQAIPTYFDNEVELPGDEAMVTWIYRLRYVELDQAQKLVDSMLNKATGDLQVYQPNLLIMSDSAVNMSRIKKLLERVDQPGYQTAIKVIDVKFAAAADLANKLTNILDPNKQAQKKAPVHGAPPPKDGAAPAADAPADDDGDGLVTKIIADERTNKIIVVATPEGFKRVRELADILDVPEGPSSAPQVHVHNLENADSEKLTAALNNLAQAGKKAVDKKKAPGAEPEGMFEGDVKVTADPATNSLVVVASLRDYRNLAKVIKRLDVRRPQVFVEAVVMEVALNRTQDLGLDWFTAYTAPVPGLGTGVGLMANPGGQNRLKGAFTTTTDPTGLAAFLGFLAFRGPSIPVKVGNNTVDLPSFGAVLNAIENDGNVDVLSTPHILTTDNVKAEILVGQTVPFAAGFTSNLGAGNISSFAPIVSVQRQDVALKFIVTPHVNTSNFVRMELDSEISDLADPVEVSPGNKQPTTTKRTTKTTVVVRDEQTVIIGGLISDKKIKSESKVPVLGDIPWLGFLFRSPHEEVRKTNLMVIMTPHIIRNDEDFRRVYERKLRERQEFMEAFYGVLAPVTGPVDWERKVGPYGALHERLRAEMMKVENGGPGLPGESIISGEEDRQAPGEIPPRRRGSEDGDSSEKPADPNAVRGAGEAVLGQPVPGQPVPPPPVEGQPPIPPAPVPPPPPPDAQ
ncbi:MAG: type II secretion system secretin GspD [Deltaproteobacteria bacterium]|nr:type II secretion system secretin GspD [Deltaproteobacteria bacterium]